MRDVDSQATGVRVRWAAFALLVMVALAAPAAAQISTFDLSGTVRDEQGGVLPGVTMAVRNESTGLTRTAVTNEQGGYFFGSLPPGGTWELKAELQGFATHRQSGLEFYANTKPTLNLTLKVGTLQESITVAGDSPLVAVGQSTLGLSVDKRQIQELPLNGRDYLDLATLASGVSDVTGAGSTVLGSKSQSISGAYSRYTSYQLDGFDNKRDMHGVQKTDVSLDAIGEFRIITNQFSAEYGETIGGIVSVITKSGTNTLQGSGFLFVRPGGWDARDRLTRRKAPFDRQDVGFTLGGPIARDRTHFFTSYEYRNEDQQAIVTAPIGGGQFQGTFPVGANRTRFLAKVNHQFNPASSMDAKFVLGDETILDGIGGLNIGENLRTNINDDITVQGTFTRLFSNSALNEVKLSYVHEDYESASSPPSFTPTGVALIYPGQGNLGATNLLQTTPERTFQIVDTFTWHTSRHTMKAGVDAFRVQTGGALHANLNGAYQFAPGAAFPFNPADPRSFPILYIQGFFPEGAAPEIVVKEWHVGIYLQDDWKVRDGLTFNLGVRYQRETSVPDSNNVAPRFGFSWDPIGTGRTAIRGGAGIFHSSVFSAIDSFEGFLSPRGLRIVTFAPGDPLFPTYPAVLPGPTLPPSVTPPPGDFYFEAAQFAQGRRKSPQSYNLTLGAEHEVIPNLAVSIDLAYAAGRKLIVPVNLNTPSFFDYSTGLRRSAQAGDATRPFGVPGRPLQPGDFSFIPGGYPFGGYRDLYLLDGIGESTYWAMKLSVTRRFAGRFAFQGHYTWSRSTNNGDDFRPGNSLPLNPDDREAERGRSFTDLPHVFSVNGSYALPWDVQLSGIVRARSGTPVDPRVGQDLNGDRNTRERPFSNGRLLERNSFRAPGFFSLDLGLSKRVRVGRTSLEGRIETFNVTNRLNPDAVSNVFGPDAGNPLPGFLRLNSALAPRQFQVSVRATF